MNSLRHGVGMLNYFEPVDIDFDGAFHCSTYIGVSGVIDFACVFMLTFAYFRAFGLVKIRDEHVCDLGSLATVFDFRSKDNQKIPE